MTTIIPDKKKVERAIKWIDSGLKEGKDIEQLLREVGMHFNLGPKDEQFLYDFYKKENKSR
ncbi:hypothetical protein KFV02_00170 [Desulfohalobiaceae bacterium Ax17]|uniref:hypothetical protein n=1 Tax=Desulfovulcanus ferrireducens TaxID=2831190 RepID=UPI00207BB641|nr:hypothetical protein [Desulfovulcanus ferrireducens]MBT8762347.1 hypothetical protein [Desulfovulcanus ferrireducens]